MRGRGERIGGGKGGEGEGREEGGEKRGTWGQGGYLGVFCIQIHHFSLIIICPFELQKAAKSARE